MTPEEIYLKHYKIANDSSNWDGAIFTTTGETFYPHTINAMIEYASIVTKEKAETIAQYEKSTQELIDADIENDRKMWLFKQQSEQLADALQESLNRINNCSEFNADFMLKAQQALSNYKKETE